MCSQNQDTIWMAYQNKILCSTNKGETFDVYQEIPTVTFTQNISFFDNVGYLGTDACRVYKFVDQSGSFVDNISCNELKVFPNPADKFLYIQGLDAVPESILIKSMTGQTWLTLNASTLHLDNDAIKIPINTLANDIYVLTAITKTQQYSVKLIVTR